MFAFRMITLASLLAASLVPSLVAAQPYPSECKPVGAPICAARVPDPFSYQPQACGAAGGPYKSLTEARNALIGADYLYPGTTTCQFTNGEETPHDGSSLIGAGCRGTQLFQPTIIDGFVTGRYFKNTFTYGGNDGSGCQNIRSYDLITVGASRLRGSEIKWGQTERRLTSTGRILTRMLTKNCEVRTNL